MTMQLFKNIVKYFKIAQNFTPRLSYHTEQMTQLTYKNPFLELQNYIEMPILKSCNSFSPSPKSLLAAEHLFRPRIDHKISLIRKTIDFQKFPIHDLPEVAFIGRSNVGKSSLIKAILKDDDTIEVKTSKKPGHTKCFMFYQVGSKLCLIDMPGYGQNQPEWLENAVVDVLQRRKNLTKLFIIIDGKIGMQETDEECIKFVEKLAVPYCVIMNKIDKASDALRLRNFLELQKFKSDNELFSCFDHPFMISSVTQEGLAHFLAFVGHITGNLSLNE